MSESRILIGTVGYPAAKKLVHANVDVIELTDAQEAPPKSSTGKKLRGDAPSNVGFTLQLPRYLFERPADKTPLRGDMSAYGSFQATGENKRLWDKAVRFAKSLEAMALVLLTPPEFTPTKTHSDALAAFLSAVDRLGLDLVWEPRGPWECDQAQAFAADLDMILAVDPLRDDPAPGDFAYFRLGPFATMGTRMGLYDLGRLKEAMMPFKKVFCVFATNRALDDARNLRKMLEEE
jgi:uncharacterized protein YecE (DUF72 family)